MNHIVVEIIGIAATVLILFSMLFKTTTLVGDIRMRVLNLVGSIVFVVYGCLLPAISTAILNGGLVIVNTYHLIMLIREYKSTPKE
ncbi:MAG: uroporphyrinogen decarboxylase [Clostridiales bacterium]|nr:uroporphyrinogen decarboxylase [Clostridiales bacterium]